MMEWLREIWCSMSAKWSAIKATYEVEETLRRGGFREESPGRWVKSAEAVQEWRDKQ